MTGQAPAVPDAFWRGIVIGMVLSAAIAWAAVLAWRIVLWL
jgi:hypothetical protein